jgi:3-oxoacyl-[acyl-carrier protein] reductase
VKYSLSGQTAVISLASSRYAVPLAKALSSRGAAIAVVDRDVAHANTVASALQASSAPAKSYAAGGSLPEVGRALRLITEELGAPSILLLCPPESACQPHALQDAASFGAILSDYLQTVYHWLSTYDKWSQKPYPQVVMITGIAAFGGWRGWSCSAAAFAAVHALARTLAVEWAKIPIRINVVAPGMTAETADEILQFDQRITQQDIIARIPQQRFITHDEVADAAIYLLSPSSSYVSGEVLRLDSGWTAWGRLYAQAR